MLHLWITDLQLKIADLSLSQHIAIISWKRFSTSHPENNTITDIPDGLLYFLCYVEVNNYGCSHSPGRNINVLSNTGPLIRHISWQRGFYDLLQLKSFTIYQWAYIRARIIESTVHPQIVRNNFLGNVAWIEPFKCVRSLCNDCRHQYSLNWQSLVLSVLTALGAISCYLSSRWWVKKYDFHLWDPHIKPTNLQVRLYIAVLPMLTLINSHLICLITLFN